MLKRSLVGIALTVLISPFSTAPGLAEQEQQPSWIMDTSSIGQDRDGIVNSNQILELGSVNPNALQLEGESALRSGDTDRAIMVLQKTIEMAPMDMDKRMLYAEALEKKLTMQKERDPRLFNFIVKQWLFIAKKAEFPDQSIQARGRLASLTGIRLGMFEKSPKYLEKVLIPEDGSKKVAIGKHGAEE